ncbi:MAM domain-containing glycosylphosphatidylinositol anchor protein 1-like [Lytechinus variegatus]|uniref:MAM domain-containing glycosylphosphatidylinositol anchor protein 1-like n=1 Tax=Lytechinus variegatus TaxID=7654 RepID=UPI001BB28B59|nr:MAM domain-containing glycosylphosphatidylinositol anchor protein 1-like [Lytechinus variegatus]
MCDYTQDQGDDFDWTRFQGRTETRETGPDVDHTHGTRLGYYLYAEASGRSEGNRARLTSLSEEVIKPQCIHFFYSMYGDTTGSLRVYVKDITSSSLGDPVWSLSDNRGGGWYRGLASVQNSTNRIQLVFEAEIGNGEYSDIAIDDVEVKEGLCPLDFLNCTFEEEVGMCGFVHDETADFDFIHWNGKTYSSDPGPAIDHTTGTEEAL